MDELLKPNNRIVITGIVFQEILQGIRDPHFFELVRKRLSQLPMILPTPEIHLHAAEIFRKLVSKGKTPSTIDVYLAALALKHCVLLFTLDSDFHRIADEFPLKLLSSPS